MKLFRFLWRFLGNLVKAIQILIMLVFIGIVVGLLVGTDIEIPESAALVIAPNGILVDQLEGDPLDRAIAEAQGAGLPQTLLRDVVDSLRAAARDDRIRVVVLRTDSMMGGGLAKLQSVAGALAEVRMAGKPIIAIGNNYSQDQYYLAAHADEIHMHELGVVYIDGYAYFRTYLKDVIEKLKIDLNVFKVGKYKSFLEPFVRNDMSAEDRRASRRWLDSMWGAYKKDVAAARGFEVGVLEEYTDRFINNLRVSGGNTARLALDAGLVDFLSSSRDIKQRLMDLAGPADQDPEMYSKIDYQSYLRILRTEEFSDPGMPEIAVLVAAGEIVDGEAPAGTIGGDTVAALVEEVANDEQIKALVLRVDSPGGSMFASEVILEQLQRLKLMGKPLVVSMSSVAASGGYYISMPADEIWASETTITGSIGVGALLPTFQRSLEEIGINIDGIGTTRLAGQFRADRELGEEVREFIQLSIEEAYRIFVGKVANSRNMSFERADNLAQGRVWIGDDALAINLVDQIGDLEDAVSSAAEMAGLGADEYVVSVVERELTFNEELVLQFLGKISGTLNLLGIGYPDYGYFGMAGKLVRQFDREFSWLKRLNDPRGIYYHCFCVFP